MPQLTSRFALALTGLALMLAFADNGGNAALTYSLALVAAMLLGVVVSANPRLQGERVSVPSWLFLGMAASLVYGIGVSQAPQLSTIRAVSLALLPLGYVVGSLAPWRTAPRALPVVLACCVLVFAVQAVLQVHGDTLMRTVPGLDTVVLLAQNPTPLVTGPFKDRNLFAGVLNLVVMTLAGWAMTLPSRRLRVGLWALVVLALACLLATRSRGGLVLLGVALVTAGLLLWRTGYRPPRHALPIGGVAVLAAALLFGAPLVERLRALGSNDASVVSRVYMVKAGAALFLDQPAGRGLGTWERVYAEYRDPPHREANTSFLHNDYLQSLVEGGPILLLGFLVPLLATGCFIRAHWRQGRAPTPESVRSAAALGGLTAITLNPAVNFIYYQPAASLLTGLVLASVAQQTLVAGGSRERTRLAGVAAGFVVCVVAAWAGLGLVSQLAASAQSPQHGAHAAKALFTPDRVHRLARLAPWDPRPVYVLHKLQLEAAAAAVTPHERMAHVQAAYQLLGEYERRDPLDATSYQNRAALLMGQAPMLAVPAPEKELERLLRRANTLNPESMPALTVLTKVLVEQGRHAEALALVERTARRVEGKHDPALNQLRKLIAESAAPRQRAPS